MDDPSDDNSLNGADGAVNPYQSPAALTPIWPRGRISRGVFLVFATILGLLAVLVAFFPPLGLPLFAIAIPSAARAYWMCHRRAFHVAVVPAEFATKSFLASLGIGTLIAISAAICFTTVCFPIGFVAVGVTYNSKEWTIVSMLLIIAAFALGIFAGGFGVYAVARKRWSRGVDPLPAPSGPV